MIPEIRTLTPGSLFFISCPLDNNALDLQDVGVLNTIDFYNFCNNKMITKIIFHVLSTHKALRTGKAVNNHALS